MQSQLSKKQRANIVLRELKKYVPSSKTILEFSNHWELLVAVMLSAQTTDKQVNVVTRTLFKKYPDLRHYLNAKASEFEKDISSVNYFRSKAKHLLVTAELLHNRFNGLIPKTAKELMTLPGVGRKTALVVLGNAHGIVEGIAVDTHVERLSRLFGLSAEKSVEKMEKELRECIPKREWFHFTNRMIAYGRAYCPARCLHDSCPIYNIIKKTDAVFT